MADGKRVGNLGALRTTQDRSSASPYAAFISYSHADDEIAGWLHKRLESYRIPKSLRGIGGRRRIGKVFRDRVDLNASHDLGGEIRKALDRSDALVLICSPRAAKSPYVAEEIRRFKETGKSESIFAIIAAGEPHAAGKPGSTPDQECFPKALICRIGPDGQISDQLEANEPIAADFRKGKDGRENGSLKILAGLLGVGLDELVQRERQAERSRRRRANLVAFAMTVLALGALVGGAAAFWQAQIANQNEARARDNEARAVSGETRAEQSAAEALRERNSAVAARDAEASAKDLANENARLAGVQELAARVGEQRAQKALAQIFLERSRSIIAFGNVSFFSTDDHGLAARYAIAGLKISADVRTEASLVLGRIMHDSISVRPVSVSSTKASRIAQNGGTFVFFGQDGASLWRPDRDKGEIFLKGKERTSQVAVSGDGARVVTATFNGAVRVWDSSDGSLLYEYSRYALPVGRIALLEIATNHDGTMVVSGAENGDVVLWEAKSGAELKRFKWNAETSVRDVEFSRDGGKVAAVSAKGDTAIWDTATGAILREWKFDGWPIGIQFSPDNTHVVTLVGAARVWGLDRRSPPLVIASDSLEILAPSSAAFSSDGTRILTFRLHSADTEIWNTTTGEQLALLSDHDSGSNALSAAFSSDDRLVVAISSNKSFEPEVVIWDALAGTRVLTLSLPEGASAFDAVFADGDKRVLVATKEGGVLSYDVSHLQLPLTELIRRACSLISEERPSMRGRFSMSEIADDVLLREAWAQNRKDVDVCAQ